MKKPLEPQLTAEMEIVTKFRQFLANWDYAHLTRKVSVEESRQMCDEFALTLATALEEDREKVLSEVEEGLSMLTRYLRSIYRLDHSDGEPPQQMLLEDDVMSVLNQLKED